VRLWRRYNLTLVVADGVKALDTAISRSGIKVARQTCLVHLKRSRRVRVLLDLLLSLAESVPTRGSPLLHPRPQGGPSSGHLAESFNSLLESSGSATPPGGQDRPGHSPQLQPLGLLSRSCNNITGTLISS